ncbi:MAG: hypothetical protein FWD22_02825 [Treponema sp.]|nr:hypothetical protein [Treponema sp.]
MKKLFILLLFIPVFAFAESMYSPTWGFYIDLPEGYEYVDGDAKDRFSFSGPGGAMFDIVVYGNRYRTITELVNDVNRMIENRGEVDLFQYRDKLAAILKLDFNHNDGWGFAVELDSTFSQSSTGTKPMLIALAYGPSAGMDLNLFHISALDSICPAESDRRYPGPITEYSYPRGNKVRVPLAFGGLHATIHENDAAASQALIEREFRLMEHYINSPNWQEAWIRYYRSIYRDSYDRILDAANIIVRSWGGPPSSGEAERRAFAQRALSLVQSHEYERDLSGSDFLNLVSVLTEGRSSCDNRSMLMAIILSRADIRAAMMISRQYSHAMGLVDLPGTGARFESHEIRWLVAETTATVDIGLIAQDVSDPRFWIGVMF